MDDKAMSHAYDSSRQADAALVQCFGVPDKPLEPIERFARDLGDLRQRWDNRLVLERCSLAELYINGRLEILAYSDWRWGLDEYVWVCRIKADGAVFHNDPGKLGVQVSDLGHGDGGDEEIVLIVVVDGAKTPKSLVRSVCRPYLIEKKFFRTGEGLLYRREPIVGYDVFPFGRNREMHFARSGRPPLSNNGVGKIIQCSPEILHRISDDACELLWDALFGPEGQMVGSLRIEVNDRVVTLVQGNLIEFPIEGAASLPQFINVAVGPLNL